MRRVGVPRPLTKREKDAIRWCGGVDAAGAICVKSAQSALGCCSSVDGRDAWQGDGSEWAAQGQRNRILFGFASFTCVDPAREPELTAPPRYPPFQPTMSFFSVLVLAALQVQTPGQQPSPQLPPSPIAKLVVTPAKPVMIAQDTLRLTAQALDAGGKPVDNVRYRYIGSGGARFEGRVDTTGLVRSGSTGTIPVTVVALVPGTRPVTEVVEVKMLPGPAAKVTIDAAAPKLVVGQQVVLSGNAYSATGDQRPDKLAWKSSAPNVARVGSDGRLTALAPGKATITGTTGPASGTLAVTVVANTIASLDIVPNAVGARTGDVLRFSVTAKDAQGRKIDGLTPTFSFSPGQGMIEQDGSFVGYEARPYTVMASIGNRVA